MIFSKFYAECYDQIHSSKGYDGESARMLKYLEANLGKSGINRILDFGCGTGIHLNSLLDGKLELYGYDRNEYMLDIARQNYPDLFVSPDYSEIPGELDLVYSLFDVVNYQVSNEEVEVFFRSLASKLAQGATVVVDGWHYSGVAQDPPETRERDILFESSTITRRVTPTTSNNYRTTVLDITLEDKSRSELLTHESHIMRAFDAPELEKFANSCGLTGVSFKDGSDWDKDLMPNSWRFVMFAEKA
jgi:SAM-dependent methyltransferase